MKKQLEMVSFGRAKENMQERVFLREDAISFFKFQKN